MQELDDNALLREFAERGSENAFASLVARHINQVYSVALRQARNPAYAEEITQAVFVILAQKSKRLRPGVILSGWLYETARLASITFLRSEIRRARREQEAFVQNTPEENAPELWTQISPLLDAGLARLNEKDRQALILRFFDGKSMNEVGVALGATEDAAKKRVSRALEKLRDFFSKRGVNSTTVLIAQTLSVNSIQTAPAALLKSASALALAKGAVSSTSTLTLAKGALKLMAWTKTTTTTTAVIVGALLVVGTTTVTIKEIRDRRPYEWETAQWNPEMLNRVPPQVRIVPAKFPPGGMGRINNQFMGIGQPLSSIFPHAYGINWARTLCQVELPTGHYDFIANLPNGSAEALQREIERKFGLKTKRETRDTQVLMLTVRNPNAPGLKPSTSRRTGLNESDGHFAGENCSISDFCGYLESAFHVPVMDGTGLDRRFDINLNWDSNSPQNDALKQALADHLGLELVATNAPIEMLVVDRK